MASARDKRAEGMLYDGMFNEPAKGVVSSSIKLKVDWKHNLYQKTKHLREKKTLKLGGKSKRLTA